MSSLTPQHRSEEASSEAAYEGLMNGLCTLIPTMGVVGMLMKRNPTFVARTNWQSRTAITIMPAMFVAALTSEQKLSHKMKEIAQETQHNTETVQWAEQQFNKQQSNNNKLQYNNTNTNNNKINQLTTLYEESIKNTGVCVVPELLWYHKIANFAQQNPLKVLAAGAVPAVGYIFYGRTEQTHLQLSSKLMHTRVFGQFATISLLLGIMGFKEFMDTNGRYISEEQMQQRINDMQYMRQQLVRKLEHDKQHIIEMKQQIKQAHEDDTRDMKHHDHHSKTNVHNKKKKKKQVEEEEIDDEDNGLAMDVLATTQSAESKE